MSNDIRDIQEQSRATVDDVYRDLRGNGFDTCECGDYRHQHKGGSGRCRMPDDATHGFEPCLAFKLALVDDGVTAAPRLMETSASRNEQPQPVVACSECGAAVDTQHSYASERALWVEYIRYVAIGETNNRSRELRAALGLDAQNRDVRGADLRARDAGTVEDKG